MAHVQLATQQVFFGRAVLKPFIPQLLLAEGVASTQVQHLAFGFVEPPEIHLDPLLSLSRSLWMVSYSSGLSTALHSLGFIK